jgi:UDP-N-acetylenolpyruvoylglucosamine reductase
MRYWSESQLKECQQLAKMDFVTDDEKLKYYNQDFGHLLQSNVAAVVIPDNIEQLKIIICFANRNSLPITIRSLGLSQSGQSIGSQEGLVIDMQNFNAVTDVEDDCLLAEANAKWREVIDKSLAASMLPLVYPYNINLSIGGVLSAGGVGASSFLHGSIVSHVLAMEVMLFDGSIRMLKPGDELFNLVLSGQGQFGIIINAKLKLRKAKSKVRSYYLLYDCHKTWLRDQFSLTSKWDYCESFCSPCIQGARLTPAGRKPFAQWFYSIHLSLEYADTLDDEQLLHGLQYTKLLGHDDDEIGNYAARHDSRFDVMKALGQWELHHPWYECFVAKDFLEDCLPEILQTITLAFGTVCHVAPLANNKAKYFMLPEEEHVASFLILAPGVHPAMTQACLASHDYLNELFLQSGGKRYLSGYLGQNIGKEFWAKHYGSYYQERELLKQKYDPNGIFCSLLHPG